MAALTELQRIAGRLEGGDIDNAQFLELFTRFMAEHIGCSRAGVWIFVDTARGHTLRCVAMYDAQANRMVGCPDLSSEAMADYFSTLEQDGVINAPEALTHPALRGFAAYLTPRDIRSVLDVCFSVNGQVFGVFSCEQVGEAADWNQRQLQALRQIASRASLSLMHSVSSNFDTAPGALWESSNPSRLATTMAMPIDGLEPKPKSH